jgi:hypothetical protein
VKHAENGALNLFEAQAAELLKEAANARGLTQGLQNIGHSISEVTGHPVNLPPILKKLPGTTAPRAPLPGITGAVDPMLSKLPAGALEIGGAPASRAAGGFNPAALGEGMVRPPLPARAPAARPTPSMPPLTADQSGVRALPTGAAAPTSAPARGAVSGKPDFSVTPTTKRVSDNAQADAPGFAELGVPFDKRIKAIQPVDESNKYVGRTDIFDMLKDHPQYQKLRQAGLSEPVAAEHIFTYDNPLRKVGSALQQFEDFMLFMKTGESVSQEKEAYFHGNTSTIRALMFSSKPPQKRKEDKEKDEEHSEKEASNRFQREMSKLITQGDSDEVAELARKAAPLKMKGRAVLDLESGVAAAKRRSQEALDALSALSRRGMSSDNKPTAHELANAEHRASQLVANAARPELLSTEAASKAVGTGKQKLLGAGAEAVAQRMLGGVTPTDVAVPEGQFVKKVYKPGSLISQGETTGKMLRDKQQYTDVTNKAALEAGEDAPIARMYGHKSHTPDLHESYHEFVPHKTLEEAPALGAPENIERLRGHLQRGEQALEAEGVVRPKILDAVLPEDFANLMGMPINPGNVVLTPEGKTKVIDFLPGGGQYKGDNVMAENFAGLRAVPRLVNAAAHIADTPEQTHLDFHRRLGAVRAAESAPADGLSLPAKAAIGVGGAAGLGGLGYVGYNALSGGKKEEEPAMKAASVEVASAEFEFIKAASDRLQRELSRMVALGDSAVPELAASAAPLRRSGRAALEYLTRGERVVPRIDSAKATIQRLTDEGGPVAAIAAAKNQLKQLEGHYAKLQGAGTVGEALPTGRQKLLGAGYEGVAQRVFGGKTPLGAPVDEGQFVRKVYNPGSLITQGDTTRQLLNDKQRFTEVVNQTAHAAGEDAPIAGWLGHKSHSPYLHESYHEYVPHRSPEQAPELIAPDNLARLRGQLSRGEDALKAQGVVNPAITDAVMQHPWGPAFGMQYNPGNIGLTPEGKTKVLDFIPTHTGYQGGNPQLDNLMSLNAFEKQKMRPEWEDLNAGGIHKKFHQQVAEAKAAPPEAAGQGGVLGAIGKQLGVHNPRVALEGLAGELGLGGWFGKKASVERPGFRFVKMGMFTRGA